MEYLFLTELGEKSSYKFGMSKINTDVLLSTSRIFEQRDFRNEIRVIEERNKGIRSSGFLELR